MSGTEKRVVQLQPARMLSAEFGRQDWVVTAEEGTQISDITDPAFWAHTASRLLPYDRVEVRIDTGEWLLEMLVMEAARNYARVVILAKYDLQPSAGEMPSEAKCEVKWAGPQNKWRVVRKADNEVISKGHENRLTAEAAMMQYERTLATT